MSRLSVNYRQILLSFRYGNIITVAMLQDYISGMTDLYAWDEYRRLMAVEQ